MQVFYLFKYFFDSYKVIISFYNYFFLTKHIINISFFINCFNFTLFKD